MTKTRRSNVSKFFFYIVLGLSVLAMVGFGLGGIFSSSTSATVATVGEVEITADEYFRTLQNELQSVSQQFGQNVSIDQALLFGVDRTVLQRLVNQAAFEGETMRVQISVSDETVKEALLATPAFQGINGSFDKDAYLDTLNRSGLTPQGYEDLIRLDNTQAILRDSILSGVEMPAATTLAIFEYIGENRGFTYARLGEDNVNGAIATPTDAELAAYYDANPDAFTQPLVRHITYVSLTPEMVAATLEIAPERVAELYEERAAEYNTPAKRFVDRIVFGSEAEAAEALVQINSDTYTFDTLAVSRGLALTDIDLGDVTARDVGTAAADVLFATEEPGVYGPVNTDIGPALFRVNASLSAQTIPLEAVAEELALEIAIEDAGDILADVTDEVIDLIAGGATLEEVANETDMELATIDLSEDAIEGIAAYSAFREEASAADIDEERDVVDLADGGIFALRVEGITEPFVKPFEEVADTVHAAVRRDIVKAAVIARGEQIATAIGVANGGSLNDFAAGLTLEVAGAVSRTSSLPDLPPIVITEIFDMEIGDITVIEDVNGAVILELSSVSPFDPADRADVLVTVGEQQTIALEQDVLDYFGSALVGASEATINQARMDSLHYQLQ